jgi:hypothetical protein
LVATENNATANDWIDNFIEKSLIANIPPKTLYIIKVRGWIKETNTGVMIFIEKTFDNEGKKEVENNCMKIVQ